MSLAARAALGLLAVALLAGPAVAAPSAAEREARHAFQNAETHFRAGRFVEALAEYQAGYDKAPLPGFLINIAQCHRRLGDLRKARATYQKFVMVAPDSSHVPEVRTLIAELDKLIVDLEGESAAASGQIANDDAAAPAPAISGAAATPPVDPAPARLPAASATAIVTAPSLVSAAEPDAGPPPAPRASRWWLWTVIGVAVAGGAATALVLTRSPAPTTLHEGTLGTLRR